MLPTKFPYINKELSWLGFNDRVLQEASDKSVPLNERIKFLGIFSSNMDEFFRVRVATLNRLLPLGEKAIRLIHADPKQILDRIQEITVMQQSKFHQVYQSILVELKKNKVFILNESEINEEQQTFVSAHFQNEVRPFLFPVMISDMPSLPRLRDQSVYLGVHLTYSQKKKATLPKKKTYAVIEVPSPPLNRFLELPAPRNEQHIMLLDDVLRYKMAEIFSTLEYDEFEAFTFKLTRDAEIDINDDYSESLFKKVARGLLKRKAGNVVRFIYDSSMPSHMFKFFNERLSLKRDRTQIIPGEKYHNFKDFFRFPKLKQKRNNLKPMPAVPHPFLKEGPSVFKKITEKDVLLHYPYQSFNHLIDFLREASMDKRVKTIAITGYRLAKNSNVVNALVNAAKNGKQVTMILELRARFDEEANIQWTTVLKENGIRVIHGVPGLKVHAKIVLVSLFNGNKKDYFAHISTGNFNESTSGLYTDHGFFTADPRITREIRHVFGFLNNNYKHYVFKHLLVSPFNFRRKIIAMMNQEIKNVVTGKKGLIILKTNNLTDPQIIRKIYQAHRSGVEIRLMVRGMFSVATDKKGFSEGLKAYGLIDRYLEHTRIYYFLNGGEERYYIASGDLMPRNLDGRVEVATPVYDKSLQAELKQYLELQWNDNVKARILDPEFKNQRNQIPGKKNIQSQERIYQFLKAKSNV